MALDNKETQGIISAALYFGFLGGMFGASTVMVYFPKISIEAGLLVGTMIGAILGTSLLWHALQKVKKKNYKGGDVIG